ncbi:MAG: hypothetical protein BWX50_01660 [Euryarchaeota archaeon ADurb.Bin009]|nr:MAG: hypothetical protein BWX50_01660 [Euryarchaeota archaeon ADurb.Bin009]
MAAELIEVRPFPESLLRDGEEVVVLDHRYRLKSIAVAEPDPPHAHGVAADRADGLLVEPEALPEPRRQDQLLVPVGRLHIHQFVAVAEVDGVDPGLPGPRELIERHLRDRSAPRRKEEEVVGPELPHRDHRGHALSAVEVQEVDEGLALAGPLPLGEVVDLQPVDLAPVGEAEEAVVHVRDEDVLDAVVVLGRHPDDAAPPAPLVPVGIQIDPLDIVR